MQPNNTSRDVLLALRERVLTAKGADREIDFWITVRMNPQSEKDDDIAIQADIDALGIEGMWIEAPYTASIDSALGLMERMLPGWCPELIRKRSAEPEHWGCKLSDQWASYATPKFSGHGPTAPLAILAALLTALAGGQAHG